MYISDKNICIDDIVAFISRYNSQKQHHIGYIGDKEQEIKDSIEHEFMDQDSLDKLFTLAYDQNQLIGLLGFNVDFKRKTAELWGPYVIDDYGDYTQIAGQLWNTGVNKLNGGIIEFHGFYNQENMNANKFMLSLGAHKMNEHIILKRNKPKSPFLLKHSIQEISPEYFDSFIELHHRTFPNTYYNGQEIINMLNEECKLFIYPVSNETVAGYCFIEGNPTFKEGSIEFISVVEDFRQQGIGLSLLHCGLNELFFNLQVGEISICVNLSNENAVRLYESAGFIIQNILNLYKIK